MNIRTIVAAAAVVAFSAVAVPASAQDRMDLTPGAVEQINLAAKLTNYGVSRSDPLLLLAAARIIATLDGESAAAAPAMSTAELLAKARELGGGNASVDAIADAIDGEAARGLCHGSGTVYGCF